jgi:hypothetical protein
MVRVVKDIYQPMVSWWRALLRLMIGRRVSANNRESQLDDHAWINTVIRGVRAVISLVYCAGTRHERLLWTWHERPLPSGQKWFDSSLLVGNKRKIFYPPAPVQMNIKWYHSLSIGERKKLNIRLECHTLSSRAWACGLRTRIRWSLMHHACPGLCVHIPLRSFFSVDDA